MPHVTPQHIAVIFMVTGALSLALNEPLAKLDGFVVKGGPFRMEQDRTRLSRAMIVAAGIGLLVLAIALVRFH